jgi:hypothetical protein
MAAKRIKTKRLMATCMIDKLYRRHLSAKIMLVFVYVSFCFRWAAYK